ncbi:hypothetical protein Y032_0016g2960 [Ancylostoma ceylanicum]|uniref:Receptor L-domain domain-containing protein n=1 Tax=Ancylostoma ceylanicum TaxID=53326 RepID=A0A016V5R4_9BILA|nr:hypothetical protein Y032_0016g2960 [Ancylostoma ceylanicum]
MTLLVTGLLYSAALIIENCAGTTCTVTNISHLEQDPTKCSVLHLNTYLDQRIVGEDNFYDFIKNIGEYETFMLRGSYLRNFTVLDTIKLHNGAQVSITENGLLEKLPKFEWNSGDTVRFTVAENHNLDTTELLKQVKARKVKGARVQRPFGNEQDP